ncbi:MAG: DNA mismatch repair endonuclease MutL [Clostridiales bacterium]
MGNIIILDENTSNMIAAGEVVERPASVVKELVENSIDANSKNISVEIKKGGISYIRITDDGVGINDDDLEIAFERHATSKIKSSNDLDKINTMGFRGEALSSIASVSKIELTSKLRDSKLGGFISIEGGKVLNFDKRGASNGTVFIVKELFYNTPARYKFLKKDSTEAGYISDIICKIAIGYPDISFKLISNNKTIIHTPGNGELKSAIYSIYKSQVASNLIDLKYDDKLCSISGFIGKPEIARSNRNYQLFYINNRIIKSKLIFSCVENSFKTYIMKNKFPFIFLKINIDPSEFDINVHPTKMEVRFKNESDIYKAIYYSIKNSLLNNNLIRSNVFEEISIKKNDVINEKDELTKKDKEDSLGKDKNRDLEKSLENELDLNNDVNKNIDSYSDRTQKINVCKVYNDILESKIDSEDKEQENKIDDNSINKTENVEMDKINYSSNNNNSIDNNLKIEDNNSKDIEIEVNKKEFNQIEIEKTSKIDTNQEFKEYKQEKDILLGSKITGQFFLTYIMLENSGVLYLIDQHAAHERILFEKLKNRKKLNNFSQMLLSPEIIELSNKEMICIRENSERFIKIGFEIEEFGINSVMIRAIPSGTIDEAVKEIFFEVLDTIMKNKFDNSYKDELLYNIACKSALKANKKLGEIEIKKLIEDLTELENPFTCPHGRPVIIRITKKEIEKMFKRIV